MTEFKWLPGKPVLLDLSGATLEAVCYGPPPASSPTLVLLHEGLGCVELWREFPQQLAARTGLGVFVYSRAGYGHSSAVALPRPLDYMTVEATQVLPQLLDIIGGRDIILLGHSDGASIASIYTGAEADDRLRALIVFAPHYFTEPFSLQAIADTRQMYERDGLREKLARFHADVDNAFYGWNDAWLDPDFVTWDIRHYLPRISVPVLAIQGCDDQYGSSLQITEIKRLTPAPVELLLLDDCRHAPQFEQRDSVLKAVTGFLTHLHLH